MRLNNHALRLVLACSLAVLGFEMTMLYRGVRALENLAAPRVECPRVEVRT